MELRDRFSERDWNFLVQLPYRIGLWMAHQDRGAGARTYQQEMTALLKALKTAQAKYANVAMLNELTNACADVQNPANDQWANAPQDCVAGLKLLRPYLDATALNCFRLMLIDVAEAVAKAAPNGTFKARNLYKGPERGWLGLYPLMANAVRLGRGPKVSRPEKMAINKLILALEASGLVQAWELDPFKDFSQA